MVVWGALAIAIVGIGLRSLLAERGSSGPSGSVAPRREGSSTGSRPPGAGPQADRELFAQVSGSVRRPGVYRLRQGARVFELVRLAGGITRGGNPDAVQLAVRVSDGMRVEIPQRAGRTGGMAGESGRPAGDGVDGAGGGTVSLSSATPEQLEQLDGIGPALARRIVEWRERNGGFASVSDLDRVPGIGPAKFAALKDAVVP